MKPRCTVTIGIPAYNESKNIPLLLRALTNQEETDIVIKEILVISDGSNDDTVKQAATIKDKRIHVIASKARMGKSSRVNQIFTKCTTDVLILIDADVTIANESIISQAVKLGNVATKGLASVNARPLRATTNIERVLETGVYLLKDIAEKWHNGNNYLLFKGCMLVLDGKAIKKIKMPKTLVNNDAFLYFSFKKLGYKPTYIKACHVHYRSPMTLHDHVKQAVRFQTSQAEMSKYFKIEAKDAYTIPRSIILKSICTYLCKRPFTTIQYILLTMYTRLQKEQHISSTWSIAESTK